MAAATPRGKATIKVIINMKNDPTNAPNTPASSGSLESPAVNKVELKF